MQFEYKGYKFGISSYKEVFHFYSQKMIERKKPQQKLKAKTLKGAVKEVEKIIDKLPKKTH